jgi:hypothetical protein
LCWQKNGIEERYDEDEKANHAHKTKRVSGK